MVHLDQFFEMAVMLFEVIGVVIMVLGLGIAFVLAGVDVFRKVPGRQIVGSLRRTFGGALLLGLEVLVAADIVKTVVSGLAAEDVMVLGLIVIIRTVLSFTLQIELEGQLP